MKKTLDSIEQKVKEIISGTGFGEVKIEIKQISDGTCIKVTKSETERHTV